MQEESLIFKKPCIVLRNATERQEGLNTNFQSLSKLDVEKTKEKIKEYTSKDFKIKPYKNPYGEKGVSKKIVEVLNQ
jgi:UDP-N-acetylglucosamine 2-epimerase